jgi:hypothetical protein
LYEILVALNNFFNDEVPFLSPMHFALINSSDLTKAKEELAAFDVWDT